VLVNGRALLDVYPGANHLDSRAFVYYPPVDTDVFRPVSIAERNVLRDELGVPHDAPLIGTIANVNPQKGIATFLEVAKQIAEMFPAARFIIAGAIAPSQSSYYDRMRAEAIRLGLSPDRLSWLGERTDVARIVAALDVKVITSVPESEGTTTTAGEAMACGIPVVATPVGAVAEVIQDGTTGFVIGSHDPASIAERVTQLLSDDDTRKTMGEAARERVISNFGVEECADVHLSAYQFALTHGASELVAPTMEKTI
jgi:glycosyltransferase involved in cell wall biosynthesis